MKRWMRPGRLALTPSSPASHAECPSRQAMEQGAHWFALLRTGEASDADRQAWQQWLDAAPGHRAAWQYVESVSQGFAALEAAPESPWAARALLAADEEVRRRRRVLACLAGCVGLPLLGLMAWRQEAVMHSLAVWTADYHTATGEILDIALPDAGRLWLDTASAVDLDYTSRWRCVRLLCGEVMVATAPDQRAGRPFLVESRHGRMWALGTRFSVRDRDDGRTTLAVHEGAVHVQPVGSDATAGKVIVQAGEQRMFSDLGVLPGSSAIAVEPTWTHRMLAMADGSLNELAVALNPYFRGHIHVDDAVAGLRVFGSFPLDDVAGALKALENSQPIQVRRILPWWISVTGRDHT